MTYYEAGIEVIKQIINNGFEAYFVGGFVRDKLLGNVNFNDIDITTSALPKDLALIFPVLTKGIKYNCVTVSYEGYNFETTTFREELSYRDNRHPSFKVADTLLEDLKRRDFTINALALTYDGKVIDAFKGLDDLDNKVVKAIGKPEIRFKEDALRMLRACYFASKLNFIIEDETLKGLKKCSYLMQTLSKDRILWELEKIINTNYPLVGLKYLVSSNLILYLDAFKKTILLILKEELKLSFFEFLFLSFYFNDDDLKNYTIKKTYKQQIKKLMPLLSLKHFTSEVIFDNGLDLVLEANKLRLILDSKYQDEKEKILKLYEELPIKNFNEIKLKSPTILKNVKLNDRKEIGIILNDVKKQILKGKLLNEEEKILEYVLKKY